MACRTRQNTHFDFMASFLSGGDDGYGEFIQWVSSGESLMGEQADVVLTEWNDLPDGEGGTVSLTHSGGVDDLGNTGDKFTETRKDADGNVTSQTEEKTVRVSTPTEEYPDKGVWSTSTTTTNPGKPDETTTVTTSFVNEDRSVSVTETSVTTSAGTTTTLVTSVDNGDGTTTVTTTITNPDGSQTQETQTISTPERPPQPPETEAPASPATDQEYDGCARAFVGEPL